MSAIGLLRVRGRAAGSLAVDLQRPPAARLFIGQAPEAVVKTVPYLFSLCAEAQRLAAQSALTAAGAIEERPADHAALWLEFIHESFWRLLLDWPPVLGLPAAQSAFADWRGARYGAHAQAATRCLFQKVLLPLAADCLRVLGSESDALDALPSGDFPPLTADAWLAYWQGLGAQPPVAIQAASVMDAYRRRLNELAMAIAAWSAGQACVRAMAGGQDIGLAQVWTARGILTHAVRLADGRVSDYRVWAPTDVHFADAEALSALLAAPDWPVELGLRPRLERAILALDPCLPYVVELEDA